MLTFLTLWLARTHGPRRLWLVMGPLVVAGALLCVLVPVIMLYHTGPLSAAGVDSWTVPVARLLCASLSHVLSRPRVPGYVRGPLVFLPALIVTAMGMW